MALPRFAVFKSKNNGKYLNYIKDEGEMHGFVRFSGEEVVSPYAKFAIETAKSGNNGGLVNIRCCYNNKYWTRLDSTTNWIIAGADQPEEDQSKSTCTLFEPVFLDQNDANTIRLRHVQLGNYACLWRGGYYACLLANSSSPDADSCDVFTITDWESLLILPKHVAFKGDNGKYLTALSSEFNASDIGYYMVPFEIFNNRDGSIRIKSDFLGTFWRRVTDFIGMNADDSTTEDPDTWFWPVKVENNNNVIALRNLGNNKFCHRHVFDMLYVTVPTITKEAHLKVEEPIFSRSIFNVNYRLGDARIYNQSILEMDNKDVTNESEEADTMEVPFTYTEKTSKTWSASVSLSLGIKVEITSGIPFLAQGKVEFSAEFSGGYKWGETDTKTTETSTVLKLVVPPKTRVKVSLIATQGTCDVPFSYSQRDTFTNGDQRISGMEDGVYTGINCFNFKYDTTEEKL